MCSPAAPVASEAKYSKHSTPETMSTTFVSWIGLPVSRISMSESRSLCSRSRSEIRRRTRERSVPLSAAHAGCAACARRTASSISAAPAIGSSASSSPVAGLKLARRDGPAPRTWRGARAGSAALAGTLAGTLAAARSMASTWVSTRLRKVAASLPARGERAACSQVPSSRAAMLAAWSANAAAGTRGRSTARRLESKRRW